MLPVLPFGAKPYPVMPDVTLTEFEGLIAREPDEVAAAFDTSGRLVLAPRRGTPVRVDFYESEADLLVRTVVTHVHPLGGPFSGADARFASDNDLIEMRAVLSSGVVYRLLRPEGGWPDGEQMQIAAEGYLFAKKPSSTESEKEYERFVFRSQRDAFAAIGVTIVKESWR